MRWEEAKEKVNDDSWGFLELRPTGRVVTKEQYDYVLYYGKNAGIAVDNRYIRPFEEEQGKYLHLGSHFGGASFYFYFSDKPEGDDKCAIFDKAGLGIVGYTHYFEEFSYGKMGRIEF